LSQIELSPDTVLCLAPTLRTRASAAGHVMIDAPNGTVVDIGPQGYAILALFARPLPLGDAIGRLETLVLMAGLDLPQRAIREQIAASVHLIVQQSRLSDGSRKVTAITEITGIGDNGDIELRPIFEYVRTGTGPGGKVLGDFRATGYLPSYLQDFIVMNLVKPGEPYL